LISFVVQGPTEYVNDLPFIVNMNGKTSVRPNENFTSQDCVDSLRQYYPGCEIIISCTTGDAQDITGIDQLFYTTDDMLEHDDNVNRQILSSQAVKHAKHDIVCKIRSDMIANSNALLPYAEKMQSDTQLAQRLTTHKMFTDYICISNWSVDKGHYYHPSDFFFLGRKEDVSSIFNIPQRLERKWKVGPEQYINLRCMENHNLQKYIDYEWLEKHGSENTHLGKNVPPDQPYIENWWKIFYNNYYVLDLGEGSGLFSKKHPERVFAHPNLVNNKQWKDGHERYIK